MEESFDRQKAKAFLFARTIKEKEQQEEERKKALEQVISVLKSTFSGTGMNIYLVGSLLRPYQFTSTSDIDIVVRNFKGDRFALWTELESLLHRNVEVILFETCHFKEFIISNGVQVL